jgi:hypothetical protein
MAHIWQDINLPGFSSAKETTESGNEPQNTPDSEPKEQQTEFKLDKAYWKEGSQGFGFNKKCFVVVEGSFLRDTVRTRIQGDLFCESKAGLEDLGSHVEGFLDKQSGKAELETTLYFGNKYYDMLKNKPAAKCKYILKKIHHTRGDREIESEPLEMPVSDVLGLGGIKLLLCDESGTVITDCHVKISMGQEELKNGILSDGTFMIDNKPSAYFKISIDTNDKPLVFELPWQRSPLIEQRIIMPQPQKENANV